MYVLLRKKLAALGCIEVKKMSAHQFTYRDNYVALLACCRAWIWRNMNVHIVIVIISVRGVPGDYLKICNVKGIRGTT
jgi:hypothetical protein